MGKKGGVEVGHAHVETGDLVLLETFLPGALYWECREFMRILMTFVGKAHRNPS